MPKFNNSPFSIDEVQGDLELVISPDRQLKLINEQVGRICTKCQNAIHLVVDGGAIRAKCEDQTENGCKWIHWNSPLPVAAGLAVVPSAYKNTVDFTNIEDYNPLDADHVILIKRKEEPYKGSWALPGGFINPLESPMVAAAREFNEETSLTGESVAQLGVCTPIPGITNVMISFSLIKVTGGIMHAADDADEVRIYSIYDIPEIKMTSHASTMESFLKASRSFQVLKSFLDQKKMSPQVFRNFIDALTHNFYNLRVE